MTVAANTPHTITNALMICFNSETVIASAARDQTDIANDPGLGGGRGRHSHESALRFSGWVKHIASVLDATKPDRTRTILS